MSTFWKMTCWTGIWWLTVTNLLTAQDNAPAPTQPGATAKPPGASTNLTLIQAMKPVFEAALLDARKQSDVTGQETIERFLNEISRALEENNISKAREILENLPQSFASKWAYFDVIEFIIGTEHRDNLTDPVIRESMANYGVHQLHYNALPRMDLRRCLAWLKFIETVKRKEPRLNPQVVDELMKLATTDEHDTKSKGPFDIVQTVQEFDRTIQQGEMKGLGSLLANALVGAPEHPETERMKLRFYLRCNLVQNRDFMQQSTSVKQVADLFCAAARRRMALGDFRAARLLAIDSIALSAPSKEPSDSPGQVLIDIQSAVTADTLQTTPQAASKPASPMGGGRLAGETRLVNLIQNPTVATGTKQPDHWQIGNAIEGVEFNWDKTVGHHDQSSLRLKKTVKRYFPIAEWFQLIPWKYQGARIKVSGYVKSEQLTKAVFDVAFLDSEENFVGHQWVSYIGEQENGPPRTQDWTEYQSEITVPANTQFLKIGLQIYGPGEVWFDDLSAVVISLPAALPEMPVEISSPAAENPDVPLLPKTNTVRSQPTVDEIQGRYEVAIDPRYADQIAKLIEEEYVTGRHQNITVQTKSLSPHATIIVVSGNPNVLNQVAEFVRGTLPQFRSNGSSARKSDETDARLTRETAELVRRIKVADAAARPQLKAELTALVKQQFQHRQNQRKQEIEELAKRVEEMRRLQLRRQENEAEITARRVSELLDEDRELRWDQSRRNPNNNTISEPDQTSPSQKVSQLPRRLPHEVTMSVSPPLQSTTTGTSGFSNQSLLYDGIPYEEWLKTLESERKPEKVFGAIEALQTMVNRQDGLRLAKAFLGAARGLKLEDGTVTISNDKLTISDPEGKLPIILNALRYLPEADVVQALIESVRNGLHPSDSYHYLGALIYCAVIPDTIRSDFAGLRRLKAPLVARGQELISAAIESKNYTEMEILQLILLLWNSAPADLSEIKGLDEMLKHQVTFDLKPEFDAFEGQMQLVIELAHIDPSRPIVNFGVSRITERLKTTWNKVCESGVDQQIQTLVEGGKTFEYPQKVFECQRMVENLTLVAASAESALPVLEQIRDTNWSTKDPLKTVPEHLQKHFQSYVTKAIASITERQRKVPKTLPEQTKS